MGPHLVYKNGQLWPQDVPLPQAKNSQYDSNDPCFSPENAPQFPAYFKDAKGNELMNMKIIFKNHKLMIVFFSRCCS